MFSNFGLKPTWSYRNGANEISLRGKHQPISQELILIGAVVLAALFGAIGTLLPESAKQTLTDCVMNPISDIFMNALNTFVGIMIFLSVVTGICSIGNISSFNKMGKYVISRFIGFTFLGTGISVICMRPFFSLSGGETAKGESQLKAIIDLITAIVPSNPIIPFAEGNMMQIIFMAILVGCALLVLENAADGIKKLANQLNAITMQAVQWICAFLPYYIFTSLVVLFWENGIGMFIKLWKPILVYAIVIVILFVLKLLSVRIKLKLKISALISRIKSTMLIGLTTASSSAAFGTVLTVNEKELGISKKLSQFGTPLANLLHGPTDGALLAVILYYLSEYYGVSVNFGWLFTAWIMCSLLCMTIPPVSGGPLVIIGMLMIQLNIPHEGLAIAGILALVLDFPSTSIGIGMKHLELVLQASHLQLWERDTIDKSS
jgi:Na+/H+-dicarboxylate symporter